MWRNEAAISAVVSRSAKCYFGSCEFYRGKLVYHMRVRWSASFICVEPRRTAAPAARGISGVRVTTLIRDCPGETIYVSKCAQRGAVLQKRCCIPRPGYVAQAFDALPTSYSHSHTLPWDPCDAPQSRPLQGAL
jgi:hypothetical protein